MNRDSVLETRQLSNGTTLHLVDASRPQAAERWIVVLEVRIDIPITADHVRSEKIDAFSPEDVQRVLGPQVTYVSRKERVFVAATEKDRLLRSFQEDFCRNALPYLSLPSFPSRYIHKRYHEILKRQSWGQAETLDP